MPSNKYNGSFVSEKTKKRKIFGYYFENRCRINLFCASLLIKKILG
jgi:hypothetical protein